MTSKHIELFKKIGSELKKELSGIYVSEEKSKIVSIGKGGDKTTLIDKFSEDSIVEKLGEFHREGNNFTLISEEMGTKKFGDPDNTDTINTIILVDPLDGSVNAKRGLPFFSVSIALIEGGTLGGITAGYVLNLMNGDEFYAIKGAGAFLNGRKIKSSKNSEFKLVGIEAPLEDSIPYIARIGKFSERIRVMGSLALDVCYTASGAFDACVFPFKSRSFDFAAGKLILEESGGIITDFSGKTLNNISPGVEKTTEIICAGNKELHEKVMEILK